MYISHDNTIHNNITIYPRVFTSGMVTIFDHASIGAGAYVHQRLKIGAYSMIGMNTSVVKNVCPYMISVNGKYTNLNEKKFEIALLSESEINQLKSIYTTISNTMKSNTTMIMAVISSYASYGDESKIRKHFEDVLPSNDYQ